MAMERGLAAACRQVDAGSVSNPRRLDQMWRIAIGNPP